MNDTTAKKPRKKFLRIPVFDPPPEARRWESPRERAAKLRARMFQFNRIYNAAYMVRYTQHGSPEYRAKQVKKFVAVLRRELENCGDPEALIFAVADAITSFSSGMPWEG
jgi:hypothetical protein